MDPRPSRVPIAVGLVLGGLALVVFGALSVPFTAGDRQQLLVALLVALVLAVAAALTTWRPAIALGVAWLGAVLQMAFALPVLPSDLVILGVLFATGASLSARLRWAGFASAIAGGVVATGYLLIPVELADVPPGILRDPAHVAVPFIVLGIAATGLLLLAWTFGLLLLALRRSRAARAAAIVARQQAIEEQERGRIARDMHDVVAHSLAVIVAQADGARYLTETDTARARETLGTVSAVAREALGDVRVLLERLRHSQGALPQPGRGDLAALLAQVRDAGLDVLLDERAMPARLPAASDLALYRIVQESLTNALRHGDTGRPVRVTIAGDDREIRLEVRSAMRAEAVPAPAGHGLLGMRERARLAGGELTSGIEAGEFVVSATLPAGEAA